MGIFNIKSSQRNDSVKEESFYNLKSETINGEPFSFDQLKGKKVMIVNTASKCGFTPQYEGLEKLHQEYGGDKFVLLGFPSNDFMNQEKGTEEEIREFCQVNYGVSFQLMRKIKVRGKKKHPVYQWLTSKTLNGKKSSSVKWNFQKYLINENGELVDVLSSATKPESSRILNFIEDGS